MGKKIGTSLTSLSRWLWSGKSKQELASNKSIGVSKTASVELSTVMDMNFCNGDMRIDREYDAVLVPSCVSESVEFDLSIGWLETFSPEFQSDDDDENDSGFAVLVPSYRHGCIEGSKGSSATLGNVIRGGSCDYSAEGKKYMEQWLSSLQGR